MRRAKKRKGIEVQRVKHPTPSWAIDALIGVEGMMSIMESRREQKERNMERVHNPATLDHLVTSFDMQGSYSEPILFAQPTGGKYCLKNK